MGCTDHLANRDYTYEYHKALPEPEQPNKTNWTIKVYGLKECGCYIKEIEKEHEHYTNISKTYYYCPEHYAQHLEKKRRDEERKEQKRAEILQKIEQEEQKLEEKQKLALCCESTPSIKQKENEMIDIIKNITAPYLKELKNNLPEHIQPMRGGKWRDLCGTFKLHHKLVEDHTCECKLKIILKDIKPSKIAKKTAKFIVPDPKRSLICMDHCDCHNNLYTHRRIIAHGYAQIRGEEPLYW